MGATRASAVVVNKSVFMQFSLIVRALTRSESDWPPVFCGSFAIATHAGGGSNILRMTYGLIEGGRFSSPTLGNSAIFIAMQKSHTAMQNGIDCHPGRVTARAGSESAVEGEEAGRHGLLLRHHVPGVHVPCDHEALVVLAQLP